MLQLYRRMDTSAHAGAGKYCGERGFVECTEPHRAAVLQVSLYSNESFTKGRSRRCSRASHSTLARSGRIVEERADVE